jgi:hypothetical protein
MTVRQGVIIKNETVSFNDDHISFPSGSNAPYHPFMPQPVLPNPNAVQDRDRRGEGIDSLRFCHSYILSSRQWWQ